jgi:hypothetical protein
VSRISGVPWLELLEKYHLEELLEKPVLEPLEKLCQRGSKYLVL